MITEYRALQDNLLEQLDELIGQVCGHERLDGHGDILRVLRFGQGGLDDLVDEWPLELVLVLEDMCPEVWVTALDKVARLRLEQAVLIAHLEADGEI